MIVQDQQQEVLFRQLLDQRLKLQGDNAHSMEVVREINGVSWINNSIATTTDLTWMALRDVEGPVILILGGIDRADDQQKLRHLVKEKVQAVICLGSTPWKYVNAFKDSTHLIIRAENISEAVATASRLANSETRAVLFSPGCPSYDAFDNYKNRGNSFRNAVNNI
jgi:UDP-N-acetylmuramoylalanine--D-glutamate ligase